MSERKQPDILPVNEHESSSSYAALRNGVNININDILLLVGSSMCDFYRFLKVPVASINIINITMDPGM